MIIKIRTVKAGLSFRDIFSEDLSTFYFARREIWALDRWIIPSTIGHMMFNGVVNIDDFLYDDWELIKIEIEYKNKTLIKKEYTYIYNNTSGWYPERIYNHSEEYYKKYLQGKIQIIENPVDIIERKVYFISEKHYERI